MKKTWVLVGALLMFPLTAQAHSVLEASTPAEGEVVTEAIEQIALDFSAGIEQGSKMTMTVDGQAVDFSDVAVMEDQLVGTPQEELLDGSYVVTYEVLSEDGHPIDGTLSFELEAGAEAAATETEEPAEEEAASEETEITESDTTEQAATPEQSAPAEDAGSNTTTLIIAALAVILLAGAVVLLRKKR